MIEQIEYVKAIAQDYTIECTDIATFRGFKTAGYNAYLRFPVTDWETVYCLIAAQVSDIYIDGPLGFSHDMFVKLKKDNDIKIRVSPTVSPNVALTDINTSNANSFFIRPEDLDKYSDVIDIIDFKIKDQEKEDTLFSIYKRGTFNFNLKELIEQLNISAPNLFITKDFAKMRLNCRQRCKTPDGNCHLCDTQLTLTNTILNYFEQSN